MFDELIQLMEEIDRQLEATNGRLDFFCTNFGQEFEINYQDLLTFVSVATMTPTFFKIGLQLSRDTTSGELFKHIPPLIDLAENLSPVEKTQEKEKLAQLTELWAKIGEITGVADETAEAEDGSEDEMEFEDYLEEAQIFSRILSHFIIVLYAYFDVYAMSLTQLIISVADVKGNEFYQIIQRISHIRDPFERIKYILQTIDKENLWNTLQKCLKTKHWDMHKDTIVTLIKLRHKVAHRKPLPTPQEFQEKFSLFKESARKQITEFVTNGQFEIPSEYFRNILITPFKGEALQLFFIIQHVAESCYRYLALVDNLVERWRTTISEKAD